MAQLAAQKPELSQGQTGEVRVKLADAVVRAQAFFADGKFDAAEQLALQILKQRPKQPQAVQIVAAIAEQRGDYAGAVKILTESLAGTSDDALALMNLCRAHRAAGRLSQALEAGAASAKYGTVPEVWADIGDTYAALGEHDLALKTFERAVALRPTLPRARLGLAHALLTKGEFQAGWAEYEWRYKLQNTRDLLPKFPQPQWNGMPLSSSRLLVVCEQGFGDCIQFARFLPAVAKRVAHLTVGCGEELKALLSNVDGHSFDLQERWEKLPPFDYQITVSSLPMVLGVTLDNISAKVPYLATDPAKAAAWRARLDAAAGGRRKVGFVWQGRPQHPNDRVRSVGLQRLTPLLELPGILPVSLQFGEGREQLVQHPLGARVVDAAGEIKDFSDSAAIISALDCVVTIDSALAHLTGALGKPGLVMLSYAGEWRWLEKRTDSPWYPTLELVRQEALGAWDGVVSRVAQRLQT